MYARSILVALLATTVCGAGVPSSAARATMPARDGAVLIGFQPGVRASRRRAIAREMGVGRIVRVGRHAHMLHVRPGDVDAAIRALRGHAEVRFAEPDYVQTVSGTPNDPQLASQWAFRNTGQSVGGTKGVAGADEHAIAAWDVTTGTSAVVVAVLDTGINYSHADLAANMWSNPGGVNGCAKGTHGYNVLKSSCSPLDDDKVYGGHGSHVAGIIGAVSNNKTGVAGVNWRTSLMAVKWVSAGGTGYTSDLVKAIDWVVRAKQAGVNVRVANDSPTWAGTAASQALSDALDELAANDILFVAAAGNTAQDDDSVPRYPCSYRKPNEICVAASDQKDGLWSSSNFGAQTVDLAAPGVNIWSTLRSSGSYGLISGCSMAAAQVSGAAALVLSLGNLSTEDLKDVILGSVDPLPAFAGVTRTGGRLDLCRAVGGCVAAPPVATAPPVVTGTAQEGATLSTTTGTWTGSPTVFLIRWQRCDAAGNACVEIANASGTSYPVASADVGSTIRSAVTASNAVGSAMAVSAATPVVQPKPVTATIALVQSASAQGSNVASLSAALPAAARAGDLVVAVVRASTTSQTVALADTAANAWTEAVHEVQTTDGHQLHLYYAVNRSTVADTVRATFSGTNGHPWLAVYELSGVDPTHPLDRTAHGTGSSASPSAGTITTSIANELVIAALGLPSSSSVTVTAGAGYTLQQQAATAGSSRAASETKTTAAAGSYAGAFQLSGSASWSALVAGFVPAPGR